MTSSWTGLIELVTPAELFSYFITIVPPSVFLAPFAMSLVIQQLDIQFYIAIESLQNFDLDSCENDVTSDGNVPQCYYPELINDIQSGDFEVEYFIPEVYCNFIFPSGLSDSISGIIGFQLSSEPLSACENIDFYASNYEALNGSSLLIADIR